MVPKRFRDRLVELGDTSVWITNALGTPSHLDVRPASLFSAYQERISRLTETPQSLLQAVIFRFRCRSGCGLRRKVAIPVSLKTGVV